MSKCVECGNEFLTGDIHWEMGLCNNCYNELYKDHKTHISLDKMWLELAIRFRDENDELQNKITDLEAKLAEKEEQIKNAIIPKFEIGQEVFIIYNEKVRKTQITSLTVFEGNELGYYCKYVDGERMYLELDESELFATKEEAEAKLKEMKDE